MKLKKSISIILSVLMIVSAFSVMSLQINAASKKYVKSIKTAKKKVSLKAGKSSKVKVTVKVAKKASKKFTVKSSNKSVAVAKVSGSKVKITAKKAGKSTITVTTKAKNKKGKKLKAKIVVTVSAAAKPNSPKPSNPSGNTQPTTPSDQKAVLKVWCPESYTRLMRRQCDRFIAANPDMVSRIDITAKAEVDAGSQLMMEPGKSADVLGVACDQLYSFISEGVIAPVDADYVADVKASNLEGAVNAATAKNNLYFFPETGNGYFLVYDKSVVPDNDAGSFEKILEDCKNSNKKFIMDAYNGYYSCIFLFTGGLRLEGLESDGITQKFNNYSTDEVVASMKAFSILMHQYSNTFVSDSTSSITEGFYDSSCGAGIDGSWNVSSNRSALGARFGAAKLPTININGEDKQMYSLYGYKALAVNSKSKYPKESQALAAFLSSKECQTERYTQLGWTPTRTDSISESSVENNAADKASIEQSKYSVPQVGIGNIWDPFGNIGIKLADRRTNVDDLDFEWLLTKAIRDINN
jgi:arabinogalactan oligomer/maltooligosaccharide transport system substrate-binding protein